MGPNGCKRVGVWVVVLGVCLGVVATASGGPDGVPGLLPIADLQEGSTLRGIRLELHARKALLADEQLAGLNLGIRVREGVATVWGSVPSKELADRAVQKVGVVQGILDVRSELLVVKPPPPPVTLPFENEGPTMTESAFPDREQGTLAPPLNPVPVVISGPTAPEPAEQRFPVPAEQLHREPEGEGRSPAVHREAEPVVKLLPPRVWTVSSADRESVEEKNPAGAPPATEAVAVAIERIRTADPRFRSLRVEIQGTALWVLSSAEQGGEAMELANQLSRIQGVSGVIVRNPASSWPR
jgi:hypothetical protein